jgi:hypothetical protein
MAADRVGSIVYWSAAVVLLLFGAVAIFSVGAPFFLTGIALLAVGRWRHQPAVVWPVLLGIWAFVLGYVLLAPWTCTGTSVPASTGAVVIERTSCTNVLGIEYSGGRLYDPSLLPAFLVGFALAIAVGLGARVLLTRRPA